MKPLVLYHAGCMDGAGAALAAWLKFGNEAEYRAVNYGQSAPASDEVRGGREVYILDFSYSREELLRLHQNTMDFSDGKPGPYAGKFVVLDHHKTAQADLADLPFCTFDVNKSGAVLAWEYFSNLDQHSPDEPDTLLPELFQYIQDRDLWKFELPYSREISAALAASGAASDFRKLTRINEECEHALNRGESYQDIAPLFLVNDGAAILRAQQQLIDRIVSSAEEITLDGHRCLSVSTPVLQSEVGNVLAIESARRGLQPIGVAYYRDGEAKIWRVSLRSSDIETDQCDDKHERIVHAAPDVSAIAKSRGGGGHAKAAGFECTRLPWESRSCSKCGGCGSVSVPGELHDVTCSYCGGTGR